MATRSADATIKGYYYQFDTTIFKLLRLAKDTDSVIIEDIEDIDIHTSTDSSAVQCKYLSKPKFINSAIREPITLMLAHYINPTTRNDLKYILYAHFEDETPGCEPIIDLLKLKDILTYKRKKVQMAYHTDNGISDAHLNSFIAQFSFIFGKEFSVQQKEVLEMIKAQFGCTDFEADTYFYNNALRIVIDKASAGNIREREVTKKDFLSAIDCRNKLFNDWYIRLRSKKEYLAIVALGMKSTKALDPSKNKCLIIGNNLLSADNASLPPVSFIENFITKYYRMSFALRNARPVLFVLDCDNNFLLDIKKKLVANGVHFNDGYEHISFNADALNRNPVINTTPSNTRIAHSSFALKIISLTTFITHQNKIEVPRVVLNFAKADCPYPKSTDYQWFDIKYCENLKDISTLIL